MWRIAKVVMFLSLSLLGRTERSGPLRQGRIPITAGFCSHGNPAKEMPSARIKAFFAYFLSPFGQKVRRLAGRDPPVIILKDREAD